MFGIRSALTGTVVTSVLAMVIGIPVAMAAALFISRVRPARIKAAGHLPHRPTGRGPERGLRALGFHLLVAAHGRCSEVDVGAPVVHSVLPRRPHRLFTSSQFIAGTILGLMVVPIIASISPRGVLAHPVAEREAAMALGASRATVVTAGRASLRRGGLIGAIMLGLGTGDGRGDRRGDHLEPQLHQPVPHPSGRRHHDRLAHRDPGSGAVASSGLAALLAAGFSLFVFTLIVNTAASFIVNRSRSAAAVEL